MLYFPQEDPSCFCSPVAKWLIYKVESYDEVQNLKSCTFSLRSSSPLNEEARKEWLGTTTSNVSLSLWAGSAFLITLIKFVTIQHHHTFTSCRTSSACSQSSVDWPPEVHRKLTSNSPKSTQLSQSQKAHMTVPSHCPHKSSPHFLCGRSNNTSSQPHPLHTFVAFPPALQSEQSHWCSLPH